MAKQFGKERAGKIRRILDGWANLLNRKEPVEKVAKARAALCATCPHLTMNLICGRCACPVPMKVRSPEEGCPENKWLPTDKIQ